MPEKGMTSQPLQARSAARLNALMDAVEVVLRTKQVSQVSVADLAAEAGLSTTYLYTRFENKQALLDYVIDRFLEEQRHAGEVIFVQGKWEINLKERLIWLAQQFQSSLSKNLGKIRALNEMNSTDESGAWLELTAAGYMKDWLLDCRDEMTHPNPETAVIVVLQMMTLGLQASAVLNPTHPGSSVPPEEIVSMAYGYLTNSVEPITFDE